MDISNRTPQRSGTGDGPIGECCRTPLKYSLDAFGNLGLNTIRQPGLNSTQFNLSKKATFRLIGDTPVTAKFEGEFFNLFNHPAFNGLGTTVGAATFGKITSALDPRNIVFKAKFSF